MIKKGNVLRKGSNHSLLGVPPHHGGNHSPSKGNQSASKGSASKGSALTASTLLDSIICNMSNNGPEVDHLDFSSISNKDVKEKHCCCSLGKRIFSHKSAEDDDFISFTLRTDKSLDHLKTAVATIDTSELKGTLPQDSALKFEKLAIPITNFKGMTSLMKDIILYATFSRYSPNPLGTNLYDLLKGKTIVSMYVWVSIYTLNQLQAYDAEFWSQFEDIVHLSTSLWKDMTKIMVSIESLRNDGQFLTRQLQNSEFKVPLKKKVKERERMKAEMDQLKKFDAHTWEQSWETDLLHPNSKRIVYTQIDGDNQVNIQTCNWVSFDSLDRKVQLRSLKTVMQYAEAILHKLLDLTRQVDLIAKKTSLDKEIRLEAFFDPDIILGMILLDRLDMLTLSANTLKHYVQEMRTTIHVCYEFARLNLKTKQVIAEYAKITNMNEMNSYDVHENVLTSHDVNLKFNTNTFHDVARMFPLITRQFAMMLQDRERVFLIPSDINLDYTAAGSEDEELQVSL